MCTAVCWRSGDHYFGRNLDLEYHYQEQVTVTPRNFPLPVRHQNRLPRHAAIIGMATVSEGYPLYYDATNEWGVSMAGLNFPGNAVYRPPVAGMDNVAPFALIPWVLGQCEDLRQARALLERVNLTDTSFSEKFPPTPLHWMLSYKDESLVLEPTAAGLQIYENPIGVLTNNPPFAYHLHNLCNYRNLTREPGENRFAQGLPLKAWSGGMGAIGLPGDLSSASRFVRAAFTRWNAVTGEGEADSVSQFFHILGAVEQQKGCARAGEGFAYTVYTSCCNTDKGIYYFTTYDHRQICAVDLHSQDLEGSQLRCFPLPESAAGSIRYLRSL